MRKNGSENMKNEKIKNTAKNEKYDKSENDNYENTAKNESENKYY